MRKHRALLLILLPLLGVCLGGCHLVEAVSYDIEDSSAYMGDKIADGGEHLGQWMRDVNR